MKLKDLDPKFLKYSKTPEGTFLLFVEKIEEADGVEFLCPKCFVTNKGVVGTHLVLCWQPGKVPDDVSPKPGRWKFVGTGLGDLSLVAGSSSILLTSGCRWHGFVKNGEVTDAG